MAIGSKKHLEQEDLWDISEQNKAAGLYEKYKKCMEETAGNNTKHPYVRLPSLESLLLTTVISSTELRTATVDNQSIIHPQLFIWRFSAQEVIE